MLRSRFYLGEIFFRGQHHQAPHPTLVSQELFDAALRLLASRSRDRSQRASNDSEYMLHGLIVCAACGMHFVGTAAHGNRYRYRYFTCFSRYRYGTQTCAADRLPADELEAAVLTCLVDTCARNVLIEHAFERAQARARAASEQHEAELTTLDAEARTAEHAIERYLHAFEASTLPEAQCGARIRDLGAKVAELRDRRAELLATIGRPGPHLPGRQQIDRLHMRLRQALEGPDPSHKPLLRSLIHEIRAEGRDSVVPVVRIPLMDQPDGKVRIDERWVDLKATVLEPGHTLPDRPYPRLWCWVWSGEASRSANIRELQDALSSIRASKSGPGVQQYEPKPAGHRTLDRPERRAREREA